jgi:cardiolipin synthase
MNTVANLLTFSRILFIPLFVSLFWIDSVHVRWVMLGIYVPVCFTDTFDGRLARSRGQVSRLGRIIDPIADKLLVTAVILMLCAFDRITGLAVLAAVIIVCREIFVSGLREFLSGLKIDVPVTLMAKAKTTIQMIALGFLIVGDASPECIPTVLIGDSVLWAAAALSVISGYDYLKAALRQMGAEEGRRDPKRCGVDTGW